MPSMANANKSPHAGAACGRATWPFREKIREITNAPIRMNSPWKTTPMAECLGVGAFDMGGLPAAVILVGVRRRHTRIHDKKGERPCGFFFHAEYVPLPNAEPRIYGVVR